MCSIRTLVGDSLSLSPERIRELSDLYEALGNETRLRILLMLMETKRPLHIRAIARELNQDYAAVYRHIQRLRKAGLVEVFEVGRSRVLALKDSDLVKNLLRIRQ